MNCGNHYHLSIEQLACLDPPKINYKSLGQICQLKNGKRCYILGQLDFIIWLYSFTKFPLFILLSSLVCTIWSIYNLYNYISLSLSLSCSHYDIDHAKFMKEYSQIFISRVTRPPTEERWRTLSAHVDRTGTSHLSLSLSLSLSPSLSLSLSPLPLYCTSDYFIPPALDLAQSDSAHQFHLRRATHSFRGNDESVLSTRLNSIITILQQQ